MSPPRTSEQELLSALTMYPNKSADELAPYLGWTIRHTQKMLLRCASSIYVSGWNRPARGAWSRRYSVGQEPNVERPPNLHKRRRELVSKVPRVTRVHGLRATGSPWDALL